MKTFVCIWVGVSGVLSLLLADAAASTNPTSQTTVQECALATDPAPSQTWLKVRTCHRCVTSADIHTNITDLLDKLSAARLFGLGHGAKPGLAQPCCSSRCLASTPRCVRWVKNLPRGWVRACPRAACRGQTAHPQGGSCRRPPCVAVTGIIPHLWEVLSFLISLLFLSLSPSSSYFISPE